MILRARTIAAEGVRAVHAIRVAAGENHLSAGAGMTGIVEQIIEACVDGPGGDVVPGLGAREEGGEVEAVGECAAAFVDRLDAVKEAIGDAAAGTDAQVIAVIVE